MNMKPMFESRKMKGLALSIILLICMSVVGNSGLVYVEHEESISFLGLTGGSPTDGSS